MPQQRNLVSPYDDDDDDDDDDVIRSAALHCQGSAGPSGLDATSWRRLCTMYHGSTKALCSAIARMARRIATETVHPQCVRSFIACRLIPLSKSPEVRPIGICETLRRIIGKVIMKIVGPEIQSVVGTSQLCAGQKSGCEIAVHLVKKLYDGDNEGVLLVDATTAFNSLSRRATAAQHPATLPVFRHLCSQLLSQRR